MKSKLGFWLILVGLIIGIGYSIWIGYGLIESQKVISSFNYATPESFPDFELYTKVGMISSWLSLVIGIILLVFIGINLIKINKKPSKRNFKFIIILSAIGLITSIFYGAIIMLIGSIIGHNSKKL